MELVEMPRNLSDDCHWMTTKPPPLGMRQPNGFLERRRRRRKDDFHFSKIYLLFQERVYHIYFPAVHANFSWIFQKHFGANFYRTSCVQLEGEEGEGWEGGYGFNGLAKKYYSRQTHLTLGRIKP